jgi:hypothetical protein
MGSVSPAAIAGVHGCHTFADPPPGVTSGTDHGWRKRAWGRTTLWEPWHHASCCCMLSSLWPNGLTRRPLAATRWRISSLSLSLQEVLIVQPPAAKT